MTNDNCYSEPVKTGEVCTIAAAKEYNIFDTMHYFNDKIPLEDIDKIDKHIDNTIDETLPYSLCKINNTSAIKNCTLSTKNPWMTLMEPLKTKCALPLNIPLPPDFKYDNVDKSKIIKPELKFRYKLKTGYCQERWYDWFTIPDYHYGNKFSIVNPENHPLNISRCYTPCKMGNVPRDNSDVTIKGLCVSKNHFQGGIYKNTFHYLPIALILLLGGNETTLKTLYKELLDDVKKTIDINNLLLDEEVYNKLYNNQEVLINIFEYGTSEDPSIKNTITNSITELFKLPFTIDNINVPDSNTINVSKHLITKSRINMAYEIASNFYNLEKAFLKNIAIPGTTDDIAITNYITWIDELALFTGQNKESFRFRKQLIILKKACNVTFDGISDYSKNYILYTLNKDTEQDEPYKIPIEFLISKEDKNFSSGVVANSDTKHKDLTPIPVAPKLTFDINHRKKKYNSLLLVNKYYDYYKYNAWFRWTITILFFIFMIYIVWIIYSVFRPYIIFIINTIYVISRNSYYNISDDIGHMFGSNKYIPSKISKNIAESDLSNINRQIATVQKSIESNVK